MPFIFKDFKFLTNGEIDLILTERSPADPSRNYVPGYRFSITLHKEDEEIGTIDIRIGYNENTYYGGHIGYHIDQKFRGHHYASKACVLLKKIAKAHEMAYLSISCNPDNLASRRTMEKAGFSFSGDRRFART